MPSATFLLLIVVSVVIASVAACGGSGSPESGTPATTAPAATPSAPAGAPVRASLHGAPAPGGSKLGDINDLSRDLLNVAQRAPSGVPEFTSDLAALVPNPPEKPQLDAFGRSIVGAVQDRSLDSVKAKQLAELLYAALYTKELSADDRARVKKDLSASLAEVGAPADRVAALESAFDQLGPVAR